MAPDHAAHHDRGTHQGHAADDAEGGEDGHGGPGRGVDVVLEGLVDGDAGHADSQAERPGDDHGDDIQAAALGLRADRGAELVGLRRRPPRGRRRSGARMRHRRRRTRPARRKLGAQGGARLPAGGHGRIDDGVPVRRRGRAGPAGAGAVAQCSNHVSLG